MISHCFKLSCVCNDGVTLNISPCHKIPPKDIITQNEKIKVYLENYALNFSFVSLIFFFYNRVNLTNGK